MSLNRTMVCGSIWRDGFWVVPKASSIDAWAMSRTASEETSFASGAAVRSGRNASSSISTPTTSTKTRLMANAGAGVQGGELAARERPERVPGEHGDRADRQVDDARAAVGRHHAEGDRGDQRAGAKAEQDELKNLLHVLPVSGAALLVTQRC